MLYSAFATLLLVGVAAFKVPQALRPMHAKSARVATNEPSRENSFSSKAVRRIQTIAEWNECTSARHCVLFVNCDWNTDMVMFRQPFSEFADWCRDNTDYQTIAVTIDGESKCALWNALQELWQNNDISPGGLKTYGGAGRVVWFSNGRVVDHAWCVDVERLDKLKARSHDAFE